MKIVVRFAPWIVFAVVGSLSWRLGAVAALATLVAVVLTSRPIRLGVLNIAMLSFFAFASVLAWVTPHTGLSDWLRPMSAAWLCLVTLVSIAVDRPFTTDFSHGSVPAEVAASPEFLEVNKEISLHWALAFAISSASSGYAVASGHALIGLAGTAAALLWALGATKRAAHAARAAS